MANLLPNAVLIATLDEGTTTYSDVGLLPASSFAYQVVVTNIMGSSIATNPVTGSTTSYPLPIAPTDLAGTWLADNDYIDLTWTNLDPYEYIIEVWRSASLFQKIATLPIGTTSYRDTTILSSKVNYIYFIRTVHIDLQYTDTEHLSLIPIYPTSLVNSINISDLVSSALTVNLLKSALDNINVFDIINRDLQVNKSISDTVNIVSSTNGAVVTANMEDLTGATFALLMNEFGAPLVDAVGGVSLALNSNDSTYGITGNGAYGMGIKFASTAGGYRKSGTTSSLNIGTGDANILLDMRIDDQPGPFAEGFCTTIMEAGDPGFSIRPIAQLGDPINSNIKLGLIATDYTTINAQWVGGAVGAALIDGLEHTWEFRIDRSLQVVELFVDGSSQGTISIATLNGKSIGTSGLGLGQDYRAGINRNVPITVWFVRFKNSVT